MKNLHKLTPNSNIPDWAKRMMLAWYYDRSNIDIPVYITATHKLRVRPSLEYSEKEWLDRGWKTQMNRRDTSEFPPPGLKFRII